jgi:hypothetical protein
MSLLTSNMFWLGSTVLAYASWIVQLGGLSALTNQYNAQAQRNSFPTTSPAATSLLGLGWWNLWFELFLIVVVTVHTTTAC